MEGQVEKVLELMVARSKGELTNNDSIEDAVQDLLNNNNDGNNGADDDEGDTKKEKEKTADPTSTQTTTSTSASRTLRPQRPLHLDTDNYDEKEDENDKSAAAAATQKENNKRKLTTVIGTSHNQQKEAATTVTWSGPKATLESVLQDDEEDEDRKRFLEAQADYPRIEALHRIRMGPEGARMMVVFGDGSKPIPAVVELALQTTRRKLLMIIHDARAVRRMDQAKFHRARQETMSSKKDTQRRYGKFQPLSTPAADTQMLYRVMTFNHDRLGYDTRWGFEVEQLKVLLPEEMNAYDRWNELHEAYADNAAKEEDTTSGTATTDADPEEDTGGIYADEKVEASLEDRNSKTPGGHLQHRAANFDIRTDRMQHDWYLSFSDYRQGSFLKKRGPKARVKTDNRGRPKQGTWTGLSPSAIRFLHWIGFDPSSPHLPPPNEELAHCLAFLCYDIMGRIVEKAIEIRLSRRSATKATTSTIKNSAADQVDENEDVKVLELPKNEQLSLEDVQEAVEHPSIRPTTLFNSESDETKHNSLSGAQLYFGPGFEDRLELELDELVMSSKKKKKNKTKTKDNASSSSLITPEELEIRKREEAFFAELASRSSAVTDLPFDDDEMNPPPPPKRMRRRMNRKPSPGATAAKKTE